MLQAVHFKCYDEGLSVMRKYESVLVKVERPKPWPKDHIRIKPITDNEYKHHIQNKLDSINDDLDQYIQDRNLEDTVWNKLKDKVKAFILNKDKK